MGVQILFGVATSALTLGIPALTVAVTDDEHLGDRMARNEIFAKAGNLATLAVAGVLTHVWSLRTIFLLWPMLAVPGIVLGLAAKSKKKAMKRQKWSRGALTSSHNFYWFVPAVFLLYLANTGGLVVFEQVFAPSHANGGAGWIAMVSALAQASVTLTIMGLARVKTPRGLVVMLAVTFGLIIVRLGVLAAGSSVINLVGGQVLDGIIGGALFSVPIRLLADQHRGEFNVLSGVLGSVGALGALASVFATGPLMSRFAYPGSLFTFMVPAALGAVLVMVARRPLEGK
jgi:MFS family permease